MSKTVFTIEINEVKRSKPEYMDMMVYRPRKAGKFKSVKDYTRKPKHKKSYED